MLWIWLNHYTNISLTLLLTLPSYFVFINFVTNFFFFFFFFFFLFLFFGCVCCQLRLLCLWGLLSHKSSSSSSSTKYMTGCAHGWPRWRAGATLWKSSTRSWRISQWSWWKSTSWGGWRTRKERAIALVNEVVLCALSLFIVHGHIGTKVNKQNLLTKHDILL